MFGMLFTIIVVLAVIYVILWSLRDNSAIGPIFNAIHPAVQKLGESIKIGLAKLATVFKKKE